MTITTNFDSARVFSSFTDWLKQTTTFVNAMSNTGLLAKYSNHAQKNSFLDEFLSGVWVLSLR